MIPIAYAVKGEQHYQSLVVYKAVHRAPVAMARLRSLALLFLRTHWTCLSTAAGGRLTHVAVVPSTRGRTGTHPMQEMLVPPLSLPLVVATANPSYSGDDREFHADRFTVPPIPNAGLAPTRVLVLDDTWTTGARVQSLAHALRTAGAESVVAVVLGRVLSPDFKPTAPLLIEIGGRPFTIVRCTAPTCTANRGTDV